MKSQQVRRMCLVEKELEDVVVVVRSLLLLLLLLLLLCGFVVRCCCDWFVSDWRSTKNRFSSLSLVLLFSVF